MLGDSDTSGLGFQLAMYRWMDDMKEARRIREENASVAVAHAQLDWMAAQQNKLISRYNELVSEANRQIKERDDRVSDMALHLARKEAEIAYLRAHEARLDGEILRLKSELDLERTRTPDPAQSETRSQQT